MRRQHLLASLLIASFALGATSCAIDETSILILGVQEPPTGEECNFTPEAESFVTRGVLDANAASSYTIILSLENQLLTSSSVGSGGFGGQNIEGNTVQVTGVSVTIEGELAGIVPSESFIPMTVTMKPEAPAAISLRIFSAQEMQVIRRTLRPLFANDPRATSEFFVKVQIQGETTSGTEVESDEFVFPAEICLGCLIAGLDYSEISAENPAPVCRTSEIPTTVDACLPGQNQGVTCTECHLYVPNLACDNTPEGCTGEDSESATARCGRLEVVEVEEAN